MDQLCDELLKVKKSYFSPRGKPNWKPLKESTLKKKRKLYPTNDTSFNTATGHLKESITVSWAQVSPSVIRITVLVEDDDALVRYLTQTLGRDFLTIDNVERSFIVSRFKKLLQENVSRS